MQQAIAPDRRHRLDPSDPFVRRHVGPGDSEIREMLAALGYESIEALVDDAVPTDIRFRAELDLPRPATEWEMLRELRDIAARNRVFRSYIGMGYNDTIVPPVIQRNVRVAEAPSFGKPVLLYDAIYDDYTCETLLARLERGSRRDGRPRDDHRLPGCLDRSGHLHPGALPVGACRGRHNPISLSYIGRIVR